MIIFGGSSSRTQYSDVHVLDFASLEWSSPQVKGTVLPRSGHSTAVLGRMLVVFGGFSATASVNDVDVLDTDAPTWTWHHAAFRAAQPDARHSHRSTEVSDGVLFIGGETESGLTLDPWRLVLPVLQVSRNLQGYDDGDDDEVPVRVGAGEGPSEEPTPKSATEPPPLVTDQ